MTLAILGGFRRASASVGALFPYGEQLIGCIECNRWGRPGDATLPMQLREDDLEAIKARRGR